MIVDPIEPCGDAIEIAGARSHVIGKEVGWLQSVAAVFVTESWRGCTIVLTGRPLGHGSRPTQAL
jgi:hypothetical protein